MQTPVIFVDDSNEMRILTLNLLKRSLNLDCLGLSSMAEVLGQAAAVLASRLVILDMNLGATAPDGFAVYHWLLEQGYKGSVFFLSGQARTTPLLAAAEQLGAKVFEKPLDAAALLEIIRMAIV